MAKEYNLARVSGDRDTYEVIEYYKSGKYYVRKKKRRAQLEGLAVSV
jgi:hypothetical protein